MENKKYFKPPMWCPICKEELVQGETFLTCENTCCTGALIGNLYKFVESLDIPNVSEKTVEILYNAKLVSSPADFYTLSMTDLTRLQGLGERSAAKIIQGFNDKKELDLATFIDSLNIFNFSKTRCETLIENGIDTLDKLFKATEEELVQCKGIGHELAQSIISGMNQKKLVIDKLLTVITIKEQSKQEVVMAKSKALDCEVVVFTGAIKREDENGDHLTRKYMTQLVYENGGTCVDSISSKNGTTMLVQVDPNSESSKSKKAKSLGIAIVSEDDFFKRIGM